MWGIRALTMYGAVLAVAIPGVLYLYDCVETILSPDTGFAIDYGTPGGVLRIECDRYSYNLSNGTLTADNITIRKPSKELLARIPSLRATGLRLNESFAPVVNIAGASVWLRRDAKGDFEIIEFFPGSSAGGEPRPWQVNLENSDIRLMDGSVPGGKTDQLVLKSASIAGKGDDLLGSADAELQGLGKTLLEFKKDANGTLLKFNKANFNAAQTLHRLRSGYEARFLKDISALKLASGTVKGNGSLYLPITKGSDMTLASNVELDATGVQWEKYQADKATFKGLITEKAVNGKVTASRQNVSIQSDGLFEYIPDPKFVGNVDFKGLTPAFIKEFGIEMPRDVNVGSVDGSVAVNADKKNISAAGSFSARSINAYGLNTPLVNARLSIRDNQLVATTDGFNLDNSQVSGTFGYHLKTQALSGSFRSPRLQGSSIRRWLPKDFVESTANVSVIVGGTVAKPILEARGTIDPVFVSGKTRYAYKNAGVAARLVGNEIFLDRIELDTGAGTAYATGKVGANGALDISVMGRGLELNAFAPNLRGTADVQARVIGTTTAPRYTGRAQGYGIGYKDIKEELLALVTNFTGDSKQISLTDIEAMHSATQLTGAVAMTFASQGLKGNLEVLGLNLQDLADVPIVGVVDVRNGIVGGTLNKPLITADIESKSLLAYNFLAENISGKAGYEGSKVWIQNGSGLVAGGTLTGINASYDPVAKTGSLDAKFDNLEIDDLVASATDNGERGDGEEENSFRLGKDVTLKGTSSGTLNATLGAKGLTSAIAKGRVDEIRVNKAFLGSGEWTVGFDGSLWRADALVGSLNEYFRLDALTFAPGSSDLSGEFTTFNIPLQELVLAVEPNLNLSSDMIDKIDLLTGKVGSYFTVRGTTKSPVVQMEELEFTDLKMGEQSLGSFTAKGDYQNSKLTIAEAILLGPRSAKVSLPLVGSVTVPDKVTFNEGSAKLSGTITDWSQLDIKGTVYGTPLNRFAIFSPSLASTNAYIDQANFNLKGTTTAPELDAKVRANVKMQDITAPSKEYKLELNANLNAKPIVGESGLNGFQVDLTAPFWLKGIQGSASANARLRSDFSLNDKAPVSAEVKFDGERDVTPFLAAIKGVETGGAGARLSGGYSLSGTLENPIFSGDTTLKIDSMRYTTVEPIIGRPIDTVLKDFVASLSVVKDEKDGYRLALKGSTTTAQSKTDAQDPTLGYVKLNAQFPIQNLFDGNFEDFSFLDTAIVNGTLESRDVSFYQSFLNNTFAQADIETEQGKPILLSGTLRNPRIAGEVYFSGVKTIIPTLNPTTSTSQAQSINPSFDLKFFLKDPANIRSSTAEVNVTGNGSLTGSLSDLNANAMFVVEDGNLLLPGGKVKLSPDGTLQLKYVNSSFENRGELLANLHGETQVTALKNGTTPERYDISIDIRGDMLSDEGLTLKATSQPGDLTQDRILALLGRTDILSNFLQSGVNSSVETDLRNAGLGLVLPSVFSSITGELARGLNLDYVGVDYNAFEGTSINVVKSFGGGLFLQGRRQLFQLLPGQPTAYDLRLAYRPRRGPNAIRALSFSIGTDQYRPYKFQIDYTSRIRTNKPTFKTIKWELPAKDLDVPKQ